MDGVETDEDRRTHASAKPTPPLQPPSTNTFSAGVGTIPHACTHVFLQVSYRLSAGVSQTTVRRVFTAWLVLGRSRAGPLLDSGRPTTGQTLMPEASWSTSSVGTASYTSYTGATNQGSAGSERERAALRTRERQRAVLRAREREADADPGSAARRDSAGARALF